VLKAEDMSNPGASLSTIFDVLNVYRVYHGIDTPASVRMEVHRLFASQQLALRLLTRSVDLFMLHRDGFRERSSLRSFCGSPMVEGSRRQQAC
jgi:hypothetical protein